MAGYLAGSGALDFSTINSVFDGRGLNLNSYRGTTWYTAAGGSGTFPSTPISFSDFYSKGPSAATVVNINALTASWTARYSATIPVVNTLTFNTNGVLTITSNGNPATLYNNFWATPSATGVGNNYWVSWTLVGVVGSSGSATASSGRVQLNTARTIVVSKSSGGTTSYTAEYDIEIWNSASGGTRVGYAPGVTLISFRTA